MLVKLHVFILLTSLVCFANGTEIKPDDGKFFYAAGNWADTAVRTVNTGKTLFMKPTKVAQEQSGHALRMEFPFPVDIIKGRFYRVSFRAWADREGDVSVAVKQKAKPCNYAGTSSTSNVDFKIGKDHKNYLFAFTATANWKKDEVQILWMFGKNVPGIKIEMENLTVEELSSYDPVDLCGTANFSFRDEVENDGKGGWSDQGPGNDFRDFPLGLNHFCHIPFKVIDPAKNQGRAILSFGCSKVATGLSETTLKLTVNRRFLYLLHTETYAPNKSIPIGSLNFKLSTGKTVERAVVHQVDVGDWWSPHDLSNGAIALEKINELTRIGAYVSCFEIPENAVEVTLKSAGVSNWIVIAATVTDFRMHREPMTICTMTADEEWRPIDLSTPYVKAGTSLDFSRHAFPAPAGKDGRIIATVDGKLAFERKSAIPIHFQGFVLEPHRIFEWPVGLNKLQKEEWKKRLDDYADAIVRGGFNLVRLHFLDQSLITPRKNTIYPIPTKPEDIPFDPIKLDLYFYLFKALKERGIYMTVDLMTSSAGYTDALVFGKDVSPDVKSGEYRETMYYDQPRRDNWKAGTIRLLNMRNPYTNTTLADDPAVVFLVFNNEQHFTWKPKHCQALDVNWQAWMKKRTGKDQAVPMLNKETAAGQSELGIAMSTFIAEIELEMNRFYEKTVRDCGYRGLTNNFNNMQTLTRVPALAELEMVTNNPYIAHPEKIGNSRLVNQNSSLSASPGLVAVLRFLDRPYFITEYNHVMWNQFRHESGLRFPVLAALHDWSGITTHCQSVFPIEEKLEPFRNSSDPINRAYEVIAHFAYTRHNVTPSRPIVAFYVTDFDIAMQGQQIINFNLSPLSWITQVGTLYAGANREGMAKIKPSLAISPINGAFRTLGDKISDRERPESVKSIVSKLKQDGLLPASNLTDVDKGIYQSANGEVILDTREQEIRIVVPKLEMATVKRKKVQRLKELTIRSASIPAGIAAISLDDSKDLSDSEKVLFIVATDALNTNMSFTSPKRLELIDLGKLPVLFRCGKFSFEFNNKTMKAPKLYALGLDGSRIEEIPITVNNGIIRFEINTIKLKEPTVFFELNQEK